ncbi:MAG: glycosyltransferase family 39 protein [Chloroflexi bacterium]|nr:glycosyltransferase family 39 protein [Chloroflexota bacterium]
MTGKRRGLLAYIAVVLWITGVFAGYYAVHKPVGAESFPPIAAEFGRLLHPWSASALADAALNLAAALWIGLVSFGLGRLALRAFRLGLTRLESRVLSTSLGLGIISLVSFFLGLAGLLYPWVFYTLFALAGVAMVGAALRERPHPNPLRAGVPSQRAGSAPGRESGSPPSSPQGRTQHPNPRSPQDEGGMRKPLPSPFGKGESGTSKPLPSPFGKGEGRVRVPLSPHLWKPSAKAIWGFARNDKSSFALAVFVALTETLALLAALAPPWAWDSLVYHLTGPGLYLEQHRITSGLDGMHFYFPPLVELLFLAGAAMKGPVVANLIHWEFGLLSVGAVFCLARRFSGVKVAWLASAVLLSAPSVVMLSSKAYVDLALLLYLTLAFGCAVEGLRSGGRNWLLLAVVFAGFAGGIKYTGLVGLLAIGVAVALEMALARRPAILLKRTASAVRSKDVEASAGESQRGCPAKASASSVGKPDAVLPRRIAGDRRNNWRLIAGCLLVAAVLASPWYIKNLFFTGNPFYPFVFGGEFWDSFRAEWVARAGSGLAGQPWRLIVAPLEMTVLGVEGGWGYQATIGPLFLVLLPLIRVEGRGLRVEERAGLVFVGVLYVVWLVGVAQSELLRQTRLLFPAFGVLSVFVASGVCRLTAVGGLNPRRFVGGAIALALVLSLTAQTVAFLADSPLPFVAGAESQEDYLARHLNGYYEAAEFVNNSLGEDARVYFLWEPRSYYFRRPVQPDTILDNWRHLLFLYGDGDAIAAALRRQGYTHVLVNLDGLRYFGEEPHREVGKGDRDALVAFEKRHLKLVYGNQVEAIHLTGQAQSGPGFYSLSRLE